MKRKFSAILTAVLSSALLFGSASSAYAAEATIVGSLKGPTSMGMVQLMSEQEALEAPDFDFTMVTAADELVASFTKGDTDIALLPANVASVLYNKTEGNVQVLDINTLGVLYLVTADTSITGIADLKGKTLYSTGKGQTPEYALNYILGENGLTAGTDVTVEYKSEHSELASLLAAGQADLAVLPQPFVTSVLAKNPDVRIALNLTEEWDKVTEDGSKLTMGALVVRKDFAESNPEAVRNFLKEYQISTQYVTDEANLDDAAALIEQYGIISAAVAKQALPYCNIVCITGEEMRTAAEGFLSILAKANPQSVGGTLPVEDFYYIGE